MEEVGYAGLRADAVAARAGVPKSTIYRRWPSMRRLAVDAVVDALGDRTFTPSDDARADVETLVDIVHTTLVDTPLARVLPALAVEVLADPEAAEEYREKVIQPLRGAAVHAVARLRPDDDLAAAQTRVDQVMGGVLYRMLFLGRPPTRSETNLSVRLVLGETRTQEGDS